MSIYIPEDRRHINKNRHEHYISNKPKINFSPTMSIFITEDRRHTCIKLGIDIIKISSDNIGYKYVLSLVICLLQPIDWSEYYLCPSNLSSYIISLYLLLSAFQTLDLSIHIFTKVPIVLSLALWAESSISFKVRF